ncbi:TniQ family protein [Shewanella oncorhynchi]|uniref:TniQ family protein n=1 Tax=Shewanella oncorhynchi TaxID=2726434 RepID=A0AA50Q5B4_9GAMM|nr:TniQ family protein [Shewanella oncorhynchi]WMB72712.1 TniQ family protein [Shewanella oncorhynchi]
MTAMPWPVHPQPLQDEIFSSWVYRAARANGQNFFSLCHLLTPEMKNTHHNYDYLTTENVVRKFSQMLSTSYKTALGTTIDSFAGYLFEQPTPKVNRRTCILQEGIKPNNYKRFSLQFCPMCLSEGEPYFRKQWRISLITVCTKHACQLHDRCPQCYSPIQPLKNEIKNKYKMPFLGEITQCFRCGFNLKETTVIQAELQTMIDTVWYEKILKSGYVSLDNKQWIYSFSFFYVLRHLIRCVLQKDLGSTSINDFIDPDIMTHEYRYRAMCELSSVFDQWPTKFLILCENLNVTYSDLTCMTKQKPLLPFWLESVVKHHLYFPNLQPSDESIKAAIDYLVAHRKRLNASELNRILGYEDSTVIKKVLKSYQKERQFHLPYMRRSNEQ